MSDTYTIRRLHRLKSGTQELAKIINNNFIKLAYIPQLNHNINEITRILNSDQMVGLALYTNNKMIGYVIGEMTMLGDGRLVYFINYIYVGTQYRNNGLASKLLEDVTTYIKTFGIRAIVLMADLSDAKLKSFYIKRGFEPDLYLDASRVANHVPLVKYLNYA